MKKERIKVDVNDVKFHSSLYPKELQSFAVALFARDPFCCRVVCTNCKKLLRHSSKKSKSGLCRKCYNDLIARKHIPSKEELESHGDMTHKKLAEIYKVSESTITSWCKLRGIKKVYNKW